MTRAAGLALGTVQWGLTYGIANRTGQPNSQAVAEMLGLAHRAGVRWLDTARAYGGSEQIIGELTGDDSSWFIATKLDPTADSAEKALNSVAASRAALKRDRLDVLLLHRAHQRSVGGVWDALRRERDAGRVGQLGVSAGTPDEAWTALNDPDVGCLQVATSLFDQRLARAGFFEAAAALNKLVFIRSVFLQGVAHLAPNDLPKHLIILDAPLTAARQWANTRGLSVGAAFLAFASGLHNAWVLIGCETPAQVIENVRCWETATKYADEARALAGTVPEFPAEILNPAVWPPALNS